jgi:hypothetical protein
MSILCLVRKQYEGASGPKLEISRKTIGGERKKATKAIYNSNILLAAALSR